MELSFYTLPQMDVDLMLTGALVGLFASTI